jgi:hypothetical protein
MPRTLARVAAALVPIVAGLAAAAAAASGAPTVTASPTVNLTPAGKAVAVTGAEIPLGTGTPPNTGLYAAQMAIVGGTTYYAYTANAKFVRRSPTPGSTSQAKLEDDGSFATTVDLVRSWTSGATTVDCAAADTRCFVASWPAHGNPTADTVIDAVALEFAGAPDPGPGPGPGPGGAFGLFVAPTTGLSTAGPSPVTVIGSGYDVREPGIYLVYGARAGRTDPGSYSSATQWLHVAGGTLSSTGSFSTTIAVEPIFTNGNGDVVNCTVVQCYVQTMRAHGATDVNQDFAVPVSFGATLTTPPPATNAAPAPAAGSSDQAPSSPTTSAGSSGPAVAPKLGKLRVNRGGRARLNVSERSTVTFVLRKQVKGTWKVVKVVRVRTPGPGTVRAKLPIVRPGTYRISIKAVSSETGKASRKVVKRLTVKAKPGRRG